MILAGKKAVVTGASRGIGRATAIALAREGAEVIVNYVSNRTAALEAEKEIKDAGGKVHLVQADVSVQSGVDTLFHEVDARLGRLDILVNNAAIAHLAPLDKTTIEIWNRVVQTNLTSILLCIQAAAQRMIPQNYGRIVNISSIGGVTGIEIDPAYAAAKAGVIGLTKSTARSLGRHNITVNVICPGFTETDMSSGLPKEARSWTIEEAALHRIGTPQDVADVILFFTSDLSRFVTGQTLLVDGGTAIF
jgi:3-oxoacyl-[acyl-carrier protein] reductase